MERKEKGRKGEGKILDDWMRWSPQGLLERQGGGQASQDLAWDERASSCNVWLTWDGASR